MFVSDLAAVPIGDTSVPATILDACGRHRPHVALTADDTGEQLTFAQLAHRIDRTGAALADRNVGRGSAVAIWAPNSPTWLVAALGAMAAGGAVTGISHLAADREAEIQLRASDASVLIAGPSLVDRAVRLSAKTGLREVVAIGDDCGVATPYEAFLASAGASPDIAAIREDDVALLPFSSGTTGLPKGVELTHRSVVTMIRQIAAALPVGPDDSLLALPPFAHVMGSMFTGLWPLARGAGVVTMPGFDPHRFVPAIAERRATIVIVPPMLAGFLAHHPAATAEALASVRLLGFGGAPTPVAALEAVASRFPRLVVGQGYGMTELTCVAAVSRLDDPGPMGSVGRLLPNTELRIVDHETGGDLTAGTAGELWIRGPQVMAGYRDSPDATAAIIDPEGWLRTGDVGRVDHDGYVFVVDRIKDLIKVKGHQVAPAELEALLLAHPAVADVAVGAVAVYGDQRPVAFVVPVAAADIDPVTLMTWSARRVAPYKRLRAIHFTDNIPRNPNGKVLRRELTARLSRLQAGSGSHDDR